jgi:pimeloyl-ACP methyl ester carboxylesterase
MDKHIRIDGIKIAYTLSGNGPAIVLLHGWMCNRTFWKEQIHFLSKEHKVLAPDFRGHGNSDIPEGGYTIEQLSEDLAKIMNGLAINQAVVVGHSMGGMVAQQFCVNNREYVSGLILAATIAADLEDQLISKLIMADTPLLGFRDAFLRYFKHWFSPDTDPHIVQWIKDQMLRTPEQVGLSLVRSYFRFDLRADLPSLSMPTLIIGAAADGSALPVESKTLADVIPDAHFEIIEGSGHFPMLESPKAFNCKLKEYLKIYNQSSKL